MVSFSYVILLYYIRLLNGLVYHGTHWSRGALFSCWSHFALRHDWTLARNVKSIMHSLHIPFPFNLISYLIKIHNFLLYLEARCSCVSPDPRRSSFSLIKYKFNFLTYHETKFTAQIMVHFLRFYLVGLHFTRLFCELTSLPGQPGFPGAPPWPISPFRKWS